MKPPSGGPITGATKAGQTITPIASMILCLGAERSTIKRPTGDMKAAAEPCTPRAAIKAEEEELAAQTSDASVNDAIAAANTLRAPNRSLAQAAAGRNIVTAI